MFESSWPSTRWVRTHPRRDLSRWTGTTVAYAPKQDQKARYFMITIDTLIHHAPPAHIENACATAVATGFLPRQ